MLSISPKNLLVAASAVALAAAVPALAQSSSSSSANPSSTSTAASTDTSATSTATATATSTATPSDSTPSNGTCNYAANSQFYAMQYSSTDCKDFPVMMATYSGPLGASMCGLVNNTASANSTSGNSSASANSTTSGLLANNTCTPDASVNSSAIRAACVDASANVTMLLDPKKTYATIRYYIGANAAQCSSDNSSIFDLSVEANTCVPASNLEGMGGGNGYVSLVCTADNSVTMQKCSDAACTSNCQTFSFNSSSTTCQMIDSSSFSSLILGAAQSSLATCENGTSPSVYMSPMCINAAATGSAESITKMSVASVASVALAVAVAVLAF